MRLPRLHFTLRWLMAAVAIAGLLIGGWCEIQRRRDAFLEKADWHASRAGMMAFFLAVWLGVFIGST